jgi:hypothetical protein
MRRRVPLSEIRTTLAVSARSRGRGHCYHREEKRPNCCFASEDDWFDYQLENDPRFLRRVERARNSPREGRGVRIEDVE